MQLLVIAATAGELQDRGIISQYADIAITGVGVPATLYNLLQFLQQKKYDLVVQAGIAGSFSPQYSPGTVVMVQQDCFADLGMEEAGQFTSIYQTAFSDKNEFPFTNGWLINTTMLTGTNHLPLVKGITVNTVTDDTGRLQQLQQHFAPDIETMEGAALHYACLRQKIPFVQLRSISNKVGVRDKSQWKIPEAVDCLNTALVPLLEQLKSH
ncbi:MAG TPA: futalosine hydrolase [Ferruginibacter sp.]|nr:futalosine hydrolase [Ferruginibacter sp.]HMP21543.1 futalosine hydrolase [Ferruginibacter sp.]